tara:strand:+ start:24365 stop:24547 length:183 start_codon:yes stop_codon:yes gene_type:complete
MEALLLSIEREAEKAVVALHVSQNFDAPSEDVNLAEAHVSSILRIILDHHYPNQKEQVTV